MKMNEIIVGDCREVMATFPDESMGMILTSPPYNVGLKYDGFEDNLSDEEFVEFNREWLKESYRIIEDTGRLYVIISDKMLWWFREIAEEEGWGFSQLLVWCKPNFVSPGRISGDWNRMSEWILLFCKGKHTSMINTYGISNTYNWFVETSPQSNHKTGKHHPAQLPSSLCQKIISRTPGDPVLDPFVGSGQVLRAAKSLNRKYIGIELVEKVAKTARKFIAGKIKNHPQQTNFDMGD